MAWTEHLPRFLERFVNLAVAPTDTRREREQKTTLVLIAGITAVKGKGDMQTYFLHRASPGVAVAPA